MIPNMISLICLKYSWNDQFWRNLQKNVFCAFCSHFFPIWASDMRFLPKFCKFYALSGLRTLKQCQMAQNMRKKLKYMCRPRFFGIFFFKQFFFQKWVIKIEKKISKYSILDTEQNIPFHLGLIFCSFSSKMTKFQFSVKNWRHLGFWPCTFLFWAKNHFFCYFM